MRCLGINKQRKRCGLNGNPFFCHHHKWQPVAFCFALLSIAGVMGGVYQDIVSPVISLFNEEEEIAERQIKKIFQSVNGYTEEKDEAHVVALLECINAFSKYISDNFEEENSFLKKLDLDINQSIEVLDISKNETKYRWITSVTWGHDIYIFTTNHMSLNKDVLNTMRRKINIIIVPSLERQDNSSINLEITNNYNKEEEILTYVSDSSFTYGDMERYLNNIGIIITSTKEKNIEPSGYSYNKNCELKRDGDLFLSYKNGTVQPAQHAVIKRIQ